MRADQLCPNKSADYGLQATVQGTDLSSLDERLTDASVRSRPATPEHVRGRWRPPYTLGIHLSITPHRRSAVRSGSYIRVRAAIFFAAPDSRDAALEALLQSRVLPQIDQTSFDTHSPKTFASKSASQRPATGLETSGRSVLYGLPSHPRLFGRTASCFLFRR